MWWKYRFWEKGISPNEFWRCSVKDIEEIMFVDNALSGKKKREQNLNALMGKL